MTLGSIPFALAQESGLSALGGAQAFSANAVVDAKGALSRRPGLVASSLYSEVLDEDGLSALHVTSDDKVYAIGGTPLTRRVFRLSGGFREYTADPGITRIGGTGRPVIAETEAMLVIASGVAPRKLVFADDTLGTLGGSPPECTHIVAQSSRLLANDMSNRGLVQYSGQALGSSITGHETWNDGLLGGFFSHEARPDPLVALAENTNELFGFGTTSLQVWTPDGQTVYAPSAAREYGCSAPYCIVKREQALAWLDHERRVVLSDGRSAEIISGPIQASLDELAVVSDAWAFWHREGVVDALVFVFPAARRAFAYNVGHGWSEWLGWSTSNWAALNLGCVAQRPYQGQRLVGTLDGRVAQLTRSAETDLGEPIVCDLRTGFLNRDTETWKTSSCAHVALRRGAITHAGGPIAWLSWRDNQDAPWTRVPVDLGSSLDRHPVVRLANLGTYRRRQWRFEFSEPTLELVGVTEQFTVNEV